MARIGSRPRLVSRNRRSVVIETSRGRTRHTIGPRGGLSGDPHMKLTAKGVVRTGTRGRAASATRVTRVGGLRNRVIPGL